MAEVLREPSARPSSLFSDLWPFLSPYRAKIGAAVVMLTIAAAATLVVPLAFRNLIDLGFSQANAQHINTYFLGLFAVACVLAGATAGRFYLVSWLGERVTADIRSAVYAHVIRMSPTFFETLKTGAVLSRLTTDTTLVQTVVGTSLSMALRNLFLFIGGLSLLVATSARLTGYIVLLLVVVVVPIVIFGRTVRKLSRVSQDLVADSSALAGETLNAAAIVQAYTHEEIEASRFRSAVEVSFAAALARIRARAWLTAVVITLVFGAIAFVLWLGAHAVLVGAMTGGQLGQFILYAVIVAGALGALSETWGDMQRAAGATERLMELLRAPMEISGPSVPRALPAKPSTISFNAVTFFYPSRPDHAALTEFSLELRPGEHLALVGPSGAGKTTLFHLLLRFYDPQSGALTIGGIDIREVDPAALRERIGIVPQDTVIFSANAIENIRYGRPEATDQEIKSAARLAAADEFIRRLPQGYDTFLGERGVRLSGGQRQRIAIARAILKNPPIMLLDEATSALDAESERLVQQALEQAARDRTTLVIAHRLATVQKADRIVVLDQGRIVAIGTHAELVRAGGLYARLAALQFNAGMLAV